MPKKAPIVDQSTEVKLKLRYPTKWGEATITELTFQRPKGKHLKHIGGDANAETVILVASKITGHVPSFFDELDVYDWKAVIGVVNDFLDDGQEDGDKN